MEVEIHPRRPGPLAARLGPAPPGLDGTVYAAVFPSLPAGEYAVLEPDGSVARRWTFPRTV